MNKLSWMYQYIEKKLIFSLLLTLFFIIGVSLCEVFLPIFLKKIVDNLALNQQITSILWLFWLYSFFLILERFFSEIQFITYFKWENGIIQNAFKTIFRSLFFNKPEFFMQHLHGAITAKIYQAIFGLDALMFDVIFKIIPTVLGFILMVSSLAIMFDLKMGLIVGVGAIFYCCCMYLFNTKLIAYQNDVRNEYNHAQGITTDFISAWKDIKLTHAYDFANNILRSRTQHIAEKNKMFYRKRGMYGFIQSLPICFVFIVVNYYAILTYTYQSSTIGNILLVNTYLFQILKPLEFFSLIFRSITKNYADFISIEELLNHERENFPLLEDKYQIESIFIKNLSVNNILNKISISINKGQKIAIIGPSGSGKTTLLNTLVGFHTDYSGDILINDINIKSIPDYTLRSHAAYLTSDARLIKETVMNNITMGNHQDVTKILKSLGMHEKIHFLENSTDTIVNENSLLFSSGEAQRLKIARTILLHRDIEIYDEATSALDHELEEEIVNYILSEKSKTVIFVTHKLHFLHKFDKIYKMEGGYVEEYVNECGHIAV